MKFKINQKVKFAKLECTVTYGPITNYPEATGDVYIIQLPINKSFDIGGLCLRAIPVNVKFLIAIPNITDFNVGDVYGLGGRDVTQIKILANYNNTFVLSGNGGNFNKLYSDAPMTREKLIDYLNENDCVKLS